jgi:hypothetical protein
MQQIEASIGNDQSLSGGAHCFRDLREFFHAHNFLFHLTTKRSARGII